jgi:hypothetical protein
MTDEPEDLEENEKKKVKKMITGELVKKKKSLINRFSSTFFGDDAGNVMQFVIQDVLIPSARDLMLDMVTKGFERLLFGDSIVSSKSRGRNRDDSIVSYGKFYRGGRGRDRDPRDRDREREPLRLSNRSSNYNFDELIIRNRGEAQTVLDKLVDMIDEYDACSVCDFYDMLGITSEYTDRKYGWDNLNVARVEPVRGGYVIALPEPIRLD